MNKHTPGPWKVNGKQSIRGPLGEYIARTNWSNGESNARLIAAAPELLAALERMCSVWVTVCNSQGWEPEHVSQYTNARAAIARAKGEA